MRILSNIMVGFTTANFVVGDFIQRFWQRHLKLYPYNNVVITKKLLKLLSWSSGDNTQAQIFPSNSWNVNYLKLCKVLDSVGIQVPGTMETGGWFRQDWGWAGISRSTWKPSYEPDCGEFCCCCLLTKSCLLLCDLKDCSSPGSSVHGISQARMLE